MAKVYTIKDALAHLRKHPPAVPDRVIADRASEIFRGYAVSEPGDFVSRSLVNMARNGSRVCKSGWKAQAIWEAMVALQLVPAVPDEIVRAVKRQVRASSNAKSPEILLQRVRELEAQLRRGGRGEEEIEVPILTPDVLKYFGFTRNPVFDEIEAEADVWWSRQHKEQERILRAACETGQAVRIAGPRGTGKSLIAEVVKARLARREDLVIAEPDAVLSSTISGSQLITVVFQALKRKAEARHEIYPESHNPARRALAMRFHLIQERKAGRRVTLWIDEAHTLKAETFLVLKRFLDESDGVGQRLLGLVLIGQNPEAAYNPRARDLSEVTMRLQTYRMESMHDEIGEYLKHKIARAGGRVSDVITPAGLKALASRCPFPLDANVLFAELLIQAYREREKPIGRDEVEEIPERAGAAASE